MKEFIPQATIDFHEFGPMTNYDIEQKLTQFLEDCYINKCKQVLVITGKGQVVRPLVGKLLKRSRYVQSYQSAGYFNGQSGAFEVALFG